MIFYLLTKFIKEPKNGKISTWSWITDITIEQGNLKLLMRGGRSRWKVENETFNTLKNQGYNFEHNYGHGNKYLSTILAMLMMLAFMILTLRTRLISE